MKILGLILVQCSCGESEVTVGLHLLHALFEGLNTSLSQSPQALTCRDGR